MNVFLFSLQINTSGINTCSCSDVEIDDFEDSTDVSVLDTEENSNYEPDNSSTDAQQEVLLKCNSSMRLFVQSAKL